MIAWWDLSPRGKSALHRARRRATPGVKQFTRSGHRNIPPASTGKGEMAVQETTGARSNAAARQPPPGARPSRDEELRFEELLVPS